MIHGKYRIIDKLAEGGQGSVYVVHNHSNEQQQILKLYSQPQDFGKLYSSFLFLSKLSHSCILTPLEFISDSPICMIFPFIRTGSLTAYLQRRKKSCSLAKVGSLVAQMANVIDYIHVNGLIHRDIKSDNFLLDLNGRIYLVDFDLMLPEASVWQRKLAAFFPFIRTNRSAGTHHYMAPEHLQGCPPHRSMDIYAFAVTVYSILSSRFPFGHNPADRFFIDRYIPIRQLNKRQNEAFRCALHPQAHQRTAGAVEFYRQLYF